MVTGDLIHSRAIESAAQVCDAYKRDGNNTKEYCCETADELAARIRGLIRQGAHPDHRQCPACMGQKQRTYPCAACGGVSTLPFAKYVLWRVLQYQEHLPADLVEEIWQVMG